MISVAFATVGPVGAGRSNRVNCSGFCQGVSGRGVTGGGGATGGGAGSSGNDHNEKAFRQTLLIAGLDVPRIDREVRRVRRLAEGRRIRERVTFYLVPVGHHDVISTERAEVEPFAEEHSTPVRTVIVNRIVRRRP